MGLLLGIGGASTGAARGRDWALLGGDPTPGEVGGVEAAADALTGLAGAAEGLAAELVGLGVQTGTSGWEGLAADGYLGAWAPLPGGASAVVEPATTASSALAGWAEALAGMQAEAADLLDQAEAAEAARQAALAALPGAESARSGTSQALHRVVHDPDATATDRMAAFRAHDRAASRVAGLRHDAEEAADDIAHLRAQAQQLADRHTDTAAFVAARISAADLPAWPHPPFGLRATGGGLLDGSAGLLLDADGDGTVSPAELVAALAHVLGGGEGMDGDAQQAAIVLLGGLLQATAQDREASRELVELLRHRGLDAQLAAAFDLGNPVLGQGFIGPLSPVQLAIRDHLVAGLFDVVAAVSDADTWRWATHLLAGIPQVGWDPARGLAPLDPIVVAAWEFYSDLFAAHPEEFLWSGMATLAGGTFYAAFQDIHVLRVALQDGTLRVEEVVELLTAGAGPAASQIAGELADLSARELAEELLFVEVAFLDMQQQIFDDMAWQHVAYAHGGIEAMELLHADGQIGDEHLFAWTDIATGDPTSIAAGNERLLHYEQLQTIGDDYDAVRDHSPVTWAVTMGMSVLAESPVPGGQPFRDVVNVDVGGYIDTPDEVDVPIYVGPFKVGEVTVNTPDRIGVEVELPVQNVSIFDKRWEWISSDMLPAWMDHVEGGTAGGLVAMPIPEQAEPQRIVPDVGPLRYDP